MACRFSLAKTLHNKINKAVESDPPEKPKSIFESLSTKLVN